jgi:hypothetical protein
VMRLAWLLHTIIPAPCRCDSGYYSIDPSVSVCQPCPEDAQCNQPAGQVQVRWKGWGLCCSWYL